MRDRAKSGLRLAGWVSLALALVYGLDVSTGLLLGKGNYNQPMYRVVGACGLAAIAVLVFATVRHWVAWISGVLCYLVMKTVFALLLFSPLIQPRLWFFEFGLLLSLSVLLCARYASREPQNAESVGLVGLVLALSFALKSDSNSSLFVGVSVLAAIQLAYRRKGRTSVEKPQEQNDSRAAVA
jgi:hypothetical protein